jgi:hypothetical protein
MPIMRTALYRREETLNTWSGISAVEGACRAAQIAA